MAGATPAVRTYTTPKYLTVNAYLVETPHGVVVIDGATALSSSRDIRQMVDETGKPLLAILLTHGHPDHYVGVGEIARGLEIPIVATQGTIDFAQYQDREKFDHLVRRNYGDDIPAARVFPNRVVSGGDVVSFDGVDFRVDDLGPCESGSDSLWITEIDGAQHVFVGDVIYNQMHSYLRDGHASNWLRALDRLLATYDHTAVFHPGHGATCGIETVHWQKAYIEAFLGTLRSLLRGGEALDDAGKDRLIAGMLSFLPSQTNLALLKYELDETIRLLAHEES